MTPETFISWRKKMGWTQQEAADALHLSREAIGQYETGRRRGTDKPYPIPHTVGLAMAALAAGLKPWSE